MPQLIRADFRDSDDARISISVERRVTPGQRAQTWLVKVRNLANPDVVTFRTFPSISLALGFASEIFTPTSTDSNHSPVAPAK